MRVATTVRPMSERNLGTIELVQGGDARDVLVLAGSSVLGNWVIEIAREAASLSEPAWDFVVCDGDTGLADLGRTEGPFRTVIVGGPNRTVIDVIAAGSPVIGVVDDPVDSVRFLAEKTGAGVVQALRAQTKYACAHEYLFENPSAHLVRRGSPTPARLIVDQLLERIGRDLDPVRRDALLDRFGGPAAESWSIETALEKTADGYCNIATMSERVSADDVAVVRRVLSPLLLGALTRDVQFRWLRSAFLSGDDPSAVVPRVADVTGAARIIFYGPYFHLPSGDWTVKLLVAFSDQVKGAPFHLRFLCMQDTLAQVMLKPAAGGAFEGEFQIRHVAPERWLEVQFSTVEGMIEGHVALGEMRFQRLAQPPARATPGAAGA